jgi:pimeloyl-ACP methyl ester carboxylesterase
MLFLLTLGGSQVRADAPTGQEVRLAAVLTHGLDRRINTERGGIRIIRFGQPQAKARAIFFIHGDPEWHRIGAFSQNLRDEETRVLANHLEWLRSIAAETHTTTYFVARTGLFGSDGETSEFRREDSYLSIGHAIDSVIDKDHIHHAAVVGHSGGAAVALYHAIDLSGPTVRCYVLASGVYNIGAMAAFMGIQKQPGADVAKIDRSTFNAKVFAPMPAEMASKFKYFEPLFHLSEMPKNPERLILAVSDRHDLTAPYFASADLIDRLKTLGQRAELLDANAKPPTHHYTYEPAIRAALSCLSNAPQRSTAQK